MFYVSIRSNAAGDFVCLLCQVHEHVDDASVSIGGRVKKQPVFNKAEHGGNRPTLRCRSWADDGYGPKLPVEKERWFRHDQIRLELISRARGASIRSCSARFCSGAATQGRNLEAISEDKRGLVAETEGAGL